jgi:hypothetical protein
MTQALKKIHETLQDIYEALKEGYENTLQLSNGRIPDLMRWVDRKLGYKR